jgi:hypothetical protein
VVDAHLVEVHHIGPLAQDLLPHAAGHLPALFLPHYDGPHHIHMCIRIRALASLGAGRGGGGGGGGPGGGDRGCGGACAGPHSDCTGALPTRHFLVGLDSHSCGTRSHLLLEVVERVSSGIHRRVTHRVELFSH